MHAHRSIALSMLLLFPLLLLACQSPVTSGGRPVANEALATAVRAVDVVEVILVTTADGLTAGFEAGLIPAQVLQQFQSILAPKLKAALATAKAAIKTVEGAPGSPPMTLVLSAVLELQKEAADLQGWWTTNAIIAQKGVAK